MEQFNTHGGYFAPRGYTKVEEGGSHEENPNGGVQLGVDPQGIPNMLEEGEPVYDDFVYSDNITADAEMLQKHNLPEKYKGKLYSDIADSYVLEAKERPNDPISNKGLEVMLGRLAAAQEEQKELRTNREIEEELAKLSPEELAELETILSSQEQPSFAPMRNGGSMNRYDLGSFLNKNLGRIRKTIGNIGDKAKELKEEEKTFPTWPRYSGAVLAGLEGLYDAFQEPDHYSIPAYSPVLPTGQLHLIDPTYAPVDENIAVNDILAQGAGTARALRNSGLGPSTGASLLALDYNLGQNVGAARAQARLANAQQRNAVIAGINNNRSAVAQFDNSLNQQRANILNDAQLHNAQNSLLLQRLNNAAESEKYAAISNQLDQVGQALSGIGQENFAMNQINGVYDYGYKDRSGRVRFNNGGTLLKKIK